MHGNNTPALRLNEQAWEILAARQQWPVFKDSFALIFLSDTHIGRQCRNDIDCSLMYNRLLQEVISNQEATGDILAIVHGGDGTHRGGQHLEEFTYLTRHALNWDQPEAEHIPLFMNIGNHEYINDPEGEQYREWVADPDPVQFVWFDELRWGVVMLNTGAKNRGYLQANEFSQALHTIKQEINCHRGYQVIIDMHIPPSIGPNTLQYLALNYRYTCEFKQLLNQYPKTITAVVTHHRHWAKMTKQGYIYRRRIPIFLTAYGGHCDCPRFSCLKLTFRRQMGGGWNMDSQLLTLNQGGQ